MPDLHAPTARHVRLLLSLLTRPADSAAWTGADWELAVRTGRTAKLLGSLHVRLEEAGVLGSAPIKAARLMDSDRRLAQHRVATARIELRAVADALREYDGPALVLKGAAYALLDLRASRGRIFEDVDVMVPKARLQEVEDALVVAGWESETPDPYDQRYYREWSHELPPMRFPGRPMQLDVHHTIVPVTARFHPDAARLVEMARPVDGTRFSVLHPAHRALHAAAHVFADSDCVSRLRDLVDLDALVREAGVEAGYWEMLFDEAKRAGLERPLWYGLDVCRRWLATPLPEVAVAWMATRAPAAPVRLGMRVALDRTLAPPSPDRRRDWLRSLAARLLFLRYLWLRMPVKLLAYHSVRKALRSVRDRLRPVTEPG
jgi:hypothetical protein